MIRLPRIAAVLLLAPLARAQDSRPAWPFAELLHERVEAERVQKGIPGLAIAIAEHGKVVHADAFGLADPDRKVPMRPDTRIRAGSVSKLFTDLAVLRLVREKKLDLDQDVRTWLPEFAPTNPFGTEITLRHLMTHHSGLLREPPLGSYFTDDGATLAATVASLATTSLLGEPGSRFRYSNAGVAVVGRVVEKVQGAPFAECIENAILRPLGLRDTSFVPAPDRLAAATMWTYDGRRFPAPRFALGIAPAGSLETTVLDLARFGSALCLDREPGLLDAATLRDAFTPQLTRKGAPSGVGLGFFVSRTGTELRVGHDGAVYGFATELAIWPERGLVIAAVATLDCANGVVAHVVEMAHTLATWSPRPTAPRFPELPRPTSPLGRDAALSYAGRYVADGAALELEARAGRLLLRPEQGFVREIRALGEETVTVDDAFGRGPYVALGDGTFVWNDRTWTRTAVPKPEPCPAAWRPLIGEYGWDHDVLYVLERDGRLQMLVEWFEYATLQPTKDPDMFRLDDRGLYANETVRIVRDEHGKVTGLVLGATPFPRRTIAPEEGVTFVIPPQKPIAELRAAALAAKPPAPAPDARRSDLVELVALEPGIRLDLRYASTNNFLGTRFYEKGRALLQRPAAEALVRAHQGLAAHGLGLLIHDAYRPWSVTKMFWDATPPALRNFVADPATGSRHNRGCAVDLTLCDLATGKPVDMVSGFDEFTPRAWPDYPGGTSVQRWHRTLLRHALEAQGFTVYDEEWWHFDFGEWRSYLVLDERL